MKKKIYYPGIRMHCPVFKSKKCYNCKNEIQFKWGWIFNIINSEKIFVCTDCFKRESEVLSYCRSLNDYLTTK